MFEIKYKKAAVKRLIKLPADIRDRFITAFETLALNPEDETLDTKQLTGRDGYRLRVGGYRAIYTVKDEELLITVIKVGPRGDIYK
jgi:mRNA interferase RelE/StbE